MADTLVIGGNGFIGRSLVRLLLELGYAPELALCARCGGPLQEEGLGFSALSACL